MRACGPGYILNENEGMTALVRRIYYRYEGENSQRHQEEARMNIANRIDWAMRVGCGKSKRGRQKKNQESKRNQESTWPK